MGLRSASQMDVKAGTAVDDWGAAMAFDFDTWLVSVESWDQPLDVQVSYDGVEWQDIFEVASDRPFVFPFQAASSRVRNNTTGSDARYQVAGLV